jgi:hypothetical protein
VTKPQRQTQGCQNLKSVKPSRRDWLKLLFCGFALITTTATASPILNPASPLNFFTNVASRLLSQELNINLTQIEIYPTNQYTPAVHRLLQVAANIYDAAYYTNNYFPISGNSSTPYLPSVFQPVFSVVTNGASTNVYITNFVEVTDTSFLANPLLDLNNSSSISTLAANPNALVFGVPLIIGAKNGFPNFNQFAMQTAFSLYRKLQVTRPATNSPPSLYQFNQMFILSLSNQLAVECWNSYANDYTRPVNIYATNYITMTLTNDEGFAACLAYVVGVPITGVNDWPGFNPDSFDYASTQFPLNTNLAIIPDSIYRFNFGGSPYLISDATNAPYETGVVINGSKYPQPQWGLTVTNNLQVVMVDVNSGRIIDYVQLSGPTTNMDLNTGVDNTQYPGATGYSGQWDTNVNNGVPAGVAYQVQVSLNNPSYYPNNQFFWNGQSTTTVENEIDAFRAFYHLTPVYNNPSGASLISTANSSLAWQVPYTPLTNLYQYITWQANDPLVHYLASDLTDPAPQVNYQNPLITVPPNQRYQPWGATMLPLPNSSTNSYNLSFKDPLVWSSDDWNFPEGQPLNPGWIGQVHRGTPWQTIFLKSTNVLSLVENNNAVGQNTWRNWTGDADATDAAAMSPVQDWHLASLITALFNTNNFTTIFPVNNPNPNAWQGLLNGLTALTNIPNQSDFTLIMSNSSQASAIANAIESERATQPGQLFSDAGDILATSQLAEQSPFLSGLDANTGISDAAYELISSQLLPLLRADSFGSVALTNGQPLVQFTGYDGHPYAIQASSDLLNWVNISTNCPLNGVFNITNPATLNASQQFYRSVLLQ